MVTWGINPGQVIQVTETVPEPDDFDARTERDVAEKALAHMDLGLEFVEAEAGDHVKERTGEALPAETVSRVQRTDATLFGAAGATAADVVILLRTAVGAYANVRPVRGFPGLDIPRPNTDLVFVRESTEGVYSGIEAEVTDGVTTLTQVVTEDASRRVASFGLGYARNHGYETVTVAHKANVMRVTEGTFLDSCRAMATERDVVVEDALMDALAMQLVQQSTDYEVIICPNLAGDVLSDLAAGLIGDLSLLPSANIGPENALFEPVHGTASDVAEEEEVANPVATILSAAMLLDYLEYPESAAAVRNATESVLEAGPRTPDLGGDATTEDVAMAVKSEFVGNA